MLSNVATSNAVPLDYEVIQSNAIKKVFFSQANTLLIPRMYHERGGMQMFGAGLGRYWIPYN